MKYLFILVFCTVSLLALEKLNLEDDSLSSETRTLLESIKRYGIKMGSGEKSTNFIFVDPMCPFSRKYITLLSTNKSVLDKNTYYIFLHKLPKYDSDALTQYIHESKNPLETLTKIMVENEEVTPKTCDLSKKELEKKSTISSVAKKLNIEIRPYIMEFEKGSKYCLVSSGSAPCMEEYDF